MRNIKSFLVDESGASAAEYVLILALIGLAIIIGAGNLGTAMDGAMTSTGTAVSNALP
ncbi:MAG: Flp/Fap pilin component [Pseudomonadota bacterium]|jgi:pilus assembly protein Flp/PilA